MISMQGVVIRAKRQTKPVACAVTNRPKKTTPIAAILPMLLQQDPLPISHDKPPNIHCISGGVGAHAPGGAICRAHFTAIIA
ncbi:hypothetical protein C8N31_101599 [Sulfitobacter mediterraneus]|uniref:Uncharacterized protein n=1 Tax=Sulfitobacter mediterraneus TaxID=83219 RepID=A0A2T6CKA5_9RHOB|nr:hypothetical protein C8N31_101599 [Sulfitobacter mediterraneus]